MAACKERKVRAGLVAAFCCLGAIVPAVCVGSNAGGHFRDGSLSWTKMEGNVVQFELLSTWMRSHSGHLVHGMPAHGHIFLGDIVRVGGQVSPKLDFGDGAFAFVDVFVTSFSEKGDWFSGHTMVDHKYDTPNNGWRINVDRYGDLHTTQGSPWGARFSGCCRWGQLTNEANQPFKLDAVFDLLQVTGFPAARSLHFTSQCAKTGPSVNCKLPGPSLGMIGPCNKVPFTTLECGNAQSVMGSIAGFITVAAAPVVPGIAVEIDGTIRTAPFGASCLPPGSKHSVGISVRDGTVGYVNIKNAGMGCFDSGDLQVQGGTAMVGGVNVQARFESEQGQIKRVIIVEKGKGYLSMPTFVVPTDTNHLCTGVLLEAMPFETHVNVLVGAVKRNSQDCVDTLKGNEKVFCDPTRVGTSVKYTENVIPQFMPHGFPGVGWGWDSDAKRPIAPRAGFDEMDINGLTGRQDAYGHVVAYAGYDLSLTFNATANWCQNADMSIIPALVNEDRCVVKGTTVSYEYGPLPENARFSMHQYGAITDLMVTYDNPFEAHRPQHEWAVNKLSRDYVNHPNSVQATQLGFTRIDFNLNSGVGGASVYLWYKVWDPRGPREGMEAITHLNISTSPEEETYFNEAAYTKLEGNLNEQAGGHNVFMWYKKSSGHVKYQDNRPTQMGMETAITNITFSTPETPSTDLPNMYDNTDRNLYFDGVQTSPSWVKVDKSLNAGTVTNNPIYLYWKKAHTNPQSQTLTWRPCACNVGRQYICVAPKTSESDTTGLDWVQGEQRCVAIDVMPDRVPEWKTPAPQELLEFYIGRETRYPIAVMVLNPNKQVQIDAELPPGAVLDVMTQPSLNCSDIGLCYARSRDLVWTPAWNQGGLQTSVCFKTSDMVTGCEPEGQAHESEVCATLLVNKCVYAINYEQHLQEIASLYTTDWLNIYSMNPTIKTPDRVLYAGQLINFGHLYHVVPGDTVHKIATVSSCTVYLSSVIRLLYLF